MEFVNSSDDTTTEFSHAVVIFPPSDRQARTMFKLIMHQELEVALTRTPAGTGTGASTSSGGAAASTKKVAWSDRGWRRKEDFHAEMDAALADGAASRSGVVIARAQTLLEAETLRTQLAVSAAQVGYYHSHCPLTIHQALSSAHVCIYVLACGGLTESYQ